MEIMKWVLSILLKVVQIKRQFRKNFRVVWSNGASVMSSGSSAFRHAPRFTEGMKMLLFLKSRRK